MKIHISFYTTEGIFFRMLQVVKDDAQCLKIIEKVVFNIASEASYVYILSGQTLIKNAKNGQFGEFFKP